MTREMEQFEKQEMQQAIDEKVRQRAHQIWQEEGCPEGRATIHWLRAEREVITPPQCCGECNDKSSKVRRSKKKVSA